MFRVKIPHQSGSTDFNRTLKSGKELKMAKRSPHISTHLPTISPSVEKEDMLENPYK